jgi:hypothetical protein
MKWLSIALWFLYASCAGSKKISTPGLEWTFFQWQSYSVGDKTFPKAAIFIPITIPTLEGLPTAVQFDLGSDATMLYENPFKLLGPQKDFFKEYWNRNTDSTYKFGRLKGYTFQMNGRAVKDPLLRVNYGTLLTRDSFRTQQKVGTLGSDFFRNKYLLIDYPGQRIAVADTLTPDVLENFSLIQARIQNNRLEVPFVIDGITYWFLFDTGASIFPLQTDKPLWDSLRLQTPVDSFKVPSWGKMVNVYTAPMKYNVYMGGLQLPHDRIYYVEAPEISTYFKSIGLSGLTGNAYFLSNTVLIDYKNKRFGVLKPKLRL